MVEAILLFLFIGACVGFILQNEDKVMSNNRKLKKLFGLDKDEE